MRRIVHHIVVLTVVAIAFVALAIAQIDQAASATQSNAVAPSAEAKPDPAELKAQQIERGKYLANDVAMCVVCHSPKDGQGNPIREQAFHGGVIPAKATYPNMKAFATNAPALGPMVGGAPEDVEYLLQTGIWRPTGQSPRPPMPPFRLSEEDAKAVVAYLRGLKLMPPQ